MRNIHALTLWFFAATILLASCKKDDDNGNTTVQNPCKVTKAYTYDIQTGTLDDSVFYTHTGNNVTKLQFSTDYVTLEYNSNNQVTRRNYFSSSSTTADEYMQISYNADGTISKVERFGKIGTTYISYYRSDVTYTSGKINKIMDYSINNGAATLLDEYTFTYTGNNITAVADKYTDNGQTVTDNYTYTYDTNSNYLQKQNSQIIFTDPLFGDFYPILVPFVLSANNIATFNDGTGNSPFSYTTDSKQNVTAVNIAGQPLIKYNYQCQ